MDFRELKTKEEILSGFDEVSICSEMPYTLNMSYSSFPIKLKTVITGVKSSNSHKSSRWYYLCKHLIT